MKLNLKHIAISLIFALAGVMVNAQSTAIDKVAQLDDVYNYYIPYSILKNLGSIGSLDILKATPITSGVIKNMNSLQFVMASKKKVVKKAQKILNDLYKDKQYAVLFNSSKNKDEKITAYAYPAGSDALKELILVVNEHDRQLIILKIDGDFSKNDIDDLEDELSDDTPSEGTEVIILDE